MDYLYIFGANVRALRLQKNLTQEQLADICGLHRTYIGAIERGNSNVSLNNMVCIAHALGVEPTDLLMYERKIDW